MIGTMTCEARANVCAVVIDVTRAAVDIANRLPSEMVQEIDPVLQRCADGVAEAVALDLAWERCNLDRGIRRNLLDIQRFAMRLHEPDLIAACGRVLNDLDRRLQQEASPCFDPTH